jgi:hypothetical protein
MPRNPRRYDLEYKAYDGTPEVKKKRAKRNAARRIMEKEGKVSKGDGKDVDHVKGVSAGNGKKNLRVKSASDNRSYPRNKDASKKRT